MEVEKRQKQELVGTIKIKNLWKKIGKQNKRQVRERKKK